MPLKAGERLGPYEIIAPIGSGGMGEVYRARDTRLNRDVALKVSGTEFSERFAREAQAVAALNHPNICTLHDIGANYLVMEYIDGEPIRGPLPLDVALRYAGQIADALDHAHRKGVVHRDLKPANILVSRQGIKLLDFGLAKFQVENAVSAGDETVITQGLTGQGMILGTVQYMSPEQLEGKEADERSDIFSFGCVLYEMIAGKRPFEGSSAARLIAAVLQETPAPLEDSGMNRVVQTCLAKNPEERWQTARELRHALRWSAQEQLAAPAVAAALPQPPPRRASRLPWALAAIAVLAAIVFAALWMWRREPGTPTIRFAVEPPPGRVFNYLITATALSPDGRFIVFRAGGEGVPSLWLRPLDSLAARPLPGTEAADFPFWSPDSNSIAFFTPDKLKKIDVSGGNPVVLCDAVGGVSGVGGTWNAAGIILFGDKRGLLSLPASGGTPALLVPAEASRHEDWYGYPQFLPGGKSFLYFAASGDANMEGVYAASLDSPQQRVHVLKTSTKATYAPTSGGGGHLLFLRDRALVARPFDAAKLRLEGEPVLVAEDLAILPGLRGAAFWLSDTGILAYRSGLALETVKLAWVSREGKRLGDAAPEASYRSFRLSADGKRAAVGRGDAESPGDIWLLDFARSLTTRLTFHPQYETVPAWSPDGRQIAFTSDRTGLFQLYRKDAGGGGQEEQLTSSQRDKYLMDWSADGKYLLYQEGGPKTRDLWALPLEAGAKPLIVVQTGFSVADGQFSPDGKWAAYTSNESGRYEVYVTAFPAVAGAAAGKWQVSNRGGRAPRWRRDGTELFYLTADSRKLMVAAIQTSASGVDTGAPRELFAVSAPGDSGDNPFPYDVTADGQRFLIEETTGTQSSVPLTVVVNWQAKGNR